jgi:TonB family protein
MPRRPSVLLLSIVVHAIVLVVIASADLRRPITHWPTPHTALAFVEATSRIVRLDDIKLPSELRPPARQQTGGSIQLTQAAPIAAPPGVAPEVAQQESIGISIGGPERIGDPDALPGGIAMPSAPVVPPPPTLKTPMRHSGIKPPSRVVYVAPVYPITARAARKDGLVIIEATIDEQGNVTDTRLLRSIPLLDEAALVAVRQWKFSPTLLNGTPVPIVMTVTVNFTLTE